MSVLRVLGLAAAALLAACVARAAPLEAYGRLPTIDDIALSADASRLAVIVTDGDARRIIVRRRSDNSVETSVALGTAKARRIDWVGNDHLIITVSAATTIKNAVQVKSEYYTVLDLDMRDRKLHPVMKDISNGVNITTGTPQARTVDGKVVLMVPGLTFANGYPRAVPALYQADLDSHTIKVVWRGDQFTRRYMYDAQGRVIAQTRIDDRRNTWTLQVRQGEDWREVKTLDRIDEVPYLIFSGRSPGTVVVAEDLPEGRAYREISVAEAAWPEPFAVMSQTSFGGFTPDHRLAWIADLVGDEDRYTFYDPAFRRIWTAVQAAFPKQRVWNVSPSDAPGRTVVLVDSVSEGQAYAYVDVAAGKAEWVGPVYGGLTADDIAPRRAIKFAAADGLGLSGYLTLPNGREARGLPLVVLPHSGPDSRDVPEFDWLAQALASRGYAVLQVNYRGSYGFGETFADAGHGQLGRKMQTDLSDGIRHLASQGVVDPKRVCIAGRGFGGYMALAGVSLEPDVYRCAASIAGQADLRRYLLYRNEASQKWWLRYAGAKQPTDGVVKAISPAHNAERIVAPVLLIHGRDDTVIPFEQSQVMADALKRAGKPVRLEFLRGEDHWLSRSETRLIALELLVGFLEEHNPPK